jgi:NAD(P)-dependent dehydrogenase (short-subunit alcohol dehydrogenase family)
MARICRVPQPGDAASKLRCLAQDMLNVVAMDETDAESVRNATTQIKDVAIDVLINSAGIAGTSGRRLAMSTMNPGPMYSMRTRWALAGAFHVVESLMRVRRVSQLK